MMCEAAGKSAIEEGARNGSFDIHIAPGHHTGKNASHQNIENGAHQQRGDDADRQVSLRILGFLRSRRNRVETDVGKKDVSRSGPNPRESEGSERDQSRSPVAGVHITKTQADHEQDHRDLDDHDGRVEARALPDSDDQDCRDDKRDQECREIEADLKSENVRRI